jgi:hypothetical protein
VWRHPSCSDLEANALNGRLDWSLQLLQKKREEEAKTEELREEQERKLEEEKARQEQEEFDKWKDMFTVEEEGSKLAEDSEESQTLLQQFVDYIKVRPPRFVVGLTDGV